MDSQGRRVSFGGRHHACQSNATLRRAIASYVRAFAAHYGQNPTVIGWQIDNELGNSHHDLCHCESCEHAFQKWLEQRYETIDALNENWGTTFWSQGYNHFGQISSPKWLATGHNPSQMLDWRRFHSDLILDFHRLQHDIIRPLSPDRFITHNMMGFADTVNYYELAEQLDFSSHDHYPCGHFRPAVDHLPALMAAELDMIRGTKQAPFWIMEQQSGIAGWDVMGRAPKPGQLALWSMQSIAHGADAIVYFRWRVATMGTEQYWHGVLPHSGIPGRNYNELKQLIQRSKPLLNELKGAMPQARVAMLFSYDQKYAIDIQPNNSELRYQEHFQKIYNAFYRQNIPVDIVGEHVDFSSYTVVVAPLQYLMTPDLSTKFSDYVAAGGKLILDMRAGVKLANNINYSDGPLPGYLRELLGITIPEYDPLMADTVSLHWLNTDVYGTARLWADLIEIDAPTCEALAYFASDFYAGTPAVTANRYGQGEAIYVGTEPDDRLLDCLVEYLSEQTDLGSLGTTAAGVELVERQTATKRFLFCLNHSGETLQLDLDPAWKPYLTGNEADHELDAYDYAMYWQDK